jgi:hypothetical protein
MIAGPHTSVASSDWVDSVAPSSRWHLPARPTASRGRCQRYGERMVHIFCGRYNSTESEDKHELCLACFQGR